jgi:cysteinyl-tRNA synthetase
MSRELLGVPFDIHGGGTDLIFPHHENEIAQSEPLMPGHEHMANVWVHGAMLNFDGRKMSKSLGNFEPLTALLERHDPLAIRLLFLQTGYRKPINFTEDSIAAANSGVAKLRKAYDALIDRNVPPGSTWRDGVDAAQLRERFFENLDDDMNTAGALGVLFEAIQSVNVPPETRRELAALMEETLAVLGVGEILTRDVPASGAVEIPPATIERLRAELGDVVTFNGESPAEVIELVIEARNAARKARDFALGDRLRNALSAEGIVLTDGKDGSTKWTVAGA